MPAPRGWVTQAQANTSLTLVQQLSRNVQIDLRLYPKGQFLPDQEEASFIGYVEGLKLDHKKQVEVFEGPFGFRRPPMRDLSTALERSTNFVSYAITSEDEKVVTKYWEYFVNIDDEYLFQIVFQGPDEKAEQLHGQFVRIMKMLTTKSK